MGVVSVTLGWLINRGDVSTLAHYKGLSHDALMTELASKYDGNLTTNIMGAVFLVLVVVVAVDLLTRLFERLWAHFSGSSGTPTQFSDGPAA